MTAKNKKSNGTGPNPGFTAGTVCGKIGLCKRYQHQRDQKQGSLRERRIIGDRLRTRTYRQWVLKRAEP